MPLGRVHHKYNLDGLIAFLKDPLAVRPSGRMPQMQLTHWEAVDVASYLLSHPEEAEATDPWELDGELTAKAKLGSSSLVVRNAIGSTPRLQRQRRCRCHKFAPIAVVCLGRKGRWPRFALTESQRQAIQAALSRESQELTKSDEIALSQVWRHQRHHNLLRQCRGIQGELDTADSTASSRRSIAARGNTALGQQFMHDMPMHVGQAVVAALEAIGESFVIGSEQMHDRCLQVVNVDTVPLPH